MNRQANILISSGYDFEGYVIKKYLGLLSGETALGTGFLSEYTASFADFFGVQSTNFSDKLAKAKNASINKLIEAVKRAGGNAIIGVDINYHPFSGNMIGVIASGTAVYIEEVPQDEALVSFRSNVPAVNYNLSSPIRPLHLDIIQIGNSIELEVWFRKYSDDIVEYLQCEIALLTVFGDEINVGKKSLKIIESTDTRFYAKITMPIIEDIQIVNSAKVIVSKVYGAKSAKDLDIREEKNLSIDEVEQLRTGFNSDAVTQARTERDCWICTCGTQNNIGEPCSLCGRTMESAVSFSLENFIDEAEQLDSSGDIYRLFKSLELNNDDLINEVESILKNNSILEKTYKNTKKDTMIQLKRLQ